MSIFIPFNFQPASVAVKTGSYTIPAGSYARVIAQVAANSTFTIDGATALDNDVTPFFKVNDVSASAGATVSYTVPADRYFEGQATCTNSASMQINVGNNAFGATPTLGTDVFPIKAGPNETIVLTVGGSDYATLSGYEYDFDVSDMRKIVQEFWVPTGTVLNGTGTVRYTVELYNEIS